jgi:hypothetical protein
MRVFRELLWIAEVAIVTAMLAAPKAVASLCAFVALGHSL